ncbi:MAG: hypothetical protein ACK5GN_10475 [Pseudomonadota bacterium]|jgi:hypothetical protein
MLSRLQAAQIFLLAGLHSCQAIYLEALEFFTKDQMLKDFFAQFYEVAAHTFSTGAEDTFKTSSTYEGVLTMYTPLKPRSVLGRFLDCLVPGLILTFSLLIAVLDSHAQNDTVTAQVYITMHTAPIDDYCAPCIASEKMLKEAQLTYRKVLEPLGPWPWFKFTDARGNQSTVRGSLNNDDITRIKKGELPKDR